ncbi:hypothetical protein LZ31DRAFT_548278 [Colletotrichum somersetense]|nr:hypothetical protein LZ31DRAFT_548278 [Colletotrichum somersetense]
MPSRTASRHVTLVGHRAREMPRARDTWLGAARLTHVLSNTRQQPPHPRCNSDCSIRLEPPDPIEVKPDMERPSHHDDAPETLRRRSETLSSTYPARRGGGT